ncbi:MAG: B12-binding domain-containing radical SAM protein [Nitrospirota bacterium]|nr:B12-binding domain-containing radical SAM protein [Nitrospirota bacterium]
MKTKKVLLISPQLRIVKQSHSIYSKNTHRRAQPLMGIGSIATILNEKGYTVKYLDSIIEDINNTFHFDEYTDCYGMGYEQLIEKVKEFAPDLVGISCLFTAQFSQAVKVASDIKGYNKDIPIVIGGNQASLTWANVMKHECFDYVLKGEGELLFPELIDAIFNNKPLDKIRSIVYRDNGSVRKTEGFEHIKDLDSLPYFNWDLVPLQKYWSEALPQNPFAKSRKSIPYETSRGCPERCIFCSTTKFFGHQWRYKSSKRVIDEISNAVKKYNVEEVEFMDDNLALHSKRFIEICEGLEGLNLHLCAPSGIRFDYIKDYDKVKEIYSKMKKAGFYQITFAVESGNEDFLNNVIKKRLDLNRMKKNISMAKDSGFKTHAFFIIGFPHETRQQINDTISYAKSLDIDSCSLSLATPFPATEMREWCERDNLLLENFEESHLLLGKTVLKRFDDLQIEELESMAEEAVASLNRKC